MWRKQQQIARTHRFCRANRDTGSAVVLRQSVRSPDLVLAAEHLPAQNGVETPQQRLEAVRGVGRRVQTLEVNVGQVLAVVYANQCAIFA